MVRANDPSHYNPIAVQRILQLKLIPDDIPQADIILSKNNSDGAASYYQFARSSKESYKATYDCLIPEISGNF